MFRSLWAFPGSSGNNEEGKAPRGTRVKARSGEEPRVTASERKEMWAYGRLETEPEMPVATRRVVQLL